MAEYSKLIEILVWISLWRILSSSSSSYFLIIERARENKMYGKCSGHSDTVAMIVSWEPYWGSSKFRVVVVARYGLLLCYVGTEIT